MCFSFQINQTSGEIQTSVSLDRETVNRHMLTVVAADNSSPESLSSQVEVLVLVEDVNDNPPVFVEKEYSLSLSLYTQPGLLLRVNVRQVFVFLGEERFMFHSILDDQMWLALCCDLLILYERVQKFHYNSLRYRYFLL